MAKYRVRFNDKARSGTVAKRNALKSKRQKQFHNDDDEEAQFDGQSTETTSYNPNAEVLVPLTAEEKEKRKAQLAESIKPQTKVSSTKRKRLEKYIDRQVRKQEQDEIFAKLASVKVDTSSYQSLSRLGAKGDINKEFGAADQDDSEDEDSDESEDQVEFEPKFTEEQPKSTFIDHRPSAAGFGFQNLPTRTASKPQATKASWRARLGLKEESEPEEESEDSDDSDDSDESDDAEEDEKPKESKESSEWTGFSDGNEAEENDDEEEQDDDEVDDDEEEEEDDDDDEDEDDNEEEEDEKPTVSRGKQFASWVKSQEEEHVHIPTPVIEGYKHVPRVEEEDPLPVDYSKGSVQRQGNHFVTVNRDPSIQESRMALPASAKEQEIIEAIHNNDYVVLTGETGSGKTTQVPQFLYESGYSSPDSPNPGMIGITQPRRVAAVSMAQRVGHELGDHGDKVGYQIRFDAKVSADTRIKFMTDGVLLRELSADLTLSKYSVLIVDEAHERSVNTDILIGILSRVVKLRRAEGPTPLKLIVMSATLRVSDFTENPSLFPTIPPVVGVEARQYPVSVHFNRRTGYDYVTEAVSKAIKIHERLPKGGILIFLTGQAEISQAIKQLKDYSKKGKLSAPSTRDEPVAARVQDSANEVSMEEETAEIDFDEDLILEDEEQEVSGDEEEEEEGFDEEYDGEQKDLHVLPLYTLLPTHEQLKVFEPQPEGTRLCVVATNVAETSLTIPGIRYVIDCGRAKQRVYDHETGVQKFKVGWVSKAAADQRAGRAGRTGPGHCYRLFSSAVYERDFQQFSEPEILRMPIEGLVLQMKSMGIHHILNFPFPTPPAKDSLSRGLKLLSYLGALEGSEQKVTGLGLQMGLFPLSPRHAKMLLIGNQHGCLPYIVALVSAFSVGEPFVQPWEIGLERPKRKTEEEEEEEVEQTTEEREKLRQLRQKYNQAQARFTALDRRSDALKLLAAVAAYDYAEDKASFCEDNFLRLKIMKEISKLRGQLAHIVAVATRPDAVESVTKLLVAKLGVPSAIQISALKQIIAVGHIDLVAVRANLIDEVDVNKKTPITRMPYKALLPTPEPYVYIHPESILASLGTEPPEFLIYHALTVGDNENSKVRMRTLVDVTAGQLANIAASSPLITYSKPLGGAHAPKLLSTTKREAWVVPRMGAAIGSGGVGWDLPPRKVVQVRVKGDWQVQV